MTTLKMHPCPLDEWVIAKPRMQISGKLVIVGIVGLALLASVASFWFHYQTGHRSVELWGREAAQLIAEAPAAELWRLLPGGETTSQGQVDTLEANGTQWLVVERHDISTARGFSNIRRSLVQDMMFDWSTTPEPYPIWRYAIWFKDGKRRATVLLDLDGLQIGLAESGARAALDAESTKALRGFVEEHFPVEKPAR